jgi:hypothetical protein
MKTNLKKYKIGLLVLLVLTIGLAGLVIVQAGGTKQDAKTDTAANNIADTLNNYVDTNQIVPTSLSEAGVSTVPSSISYQKLSDSSYKFCITYKSNSSGFDASGAVSNVVTGGTIFNTPLQPADNSTLIIDTTHHKGANCQTVQPLISPTPVPLCLGTNKAGVACPNQPATTTSICDYNAQSTSGCKVQCATPTQNTAPKFIDGTIKTINNDSSGNVTSLVVEDTKNVSHTVTLATNAGVNDSYCTQLDPTTMQTSDQVRVVISGSATTTSANITASEIDDFSE